MNMKENCQTCTNPTKYVFGLWDGPNGTFGDLFECHNLDCELKQERMKIFTNSEEEKKKVIATNERNGIFMELIKGTRKSLGITIMKMSKGLGISPSTYSNYETCREPFPVEMVNRINEILSEITSNSYTESSSWTIKFRNKGIDTNG